MVFGKTLHRQFVLALLVINCVCSMCIAESCIKEEEEFVQLSAEYIHGSEKDGTDPFSLQEGEFPHSSLVKVELSAENGGLNIHHSIGGSIGQCLATNAIKENAVSEVTGSSGNSIRKPTAHATVASKLAIVVTGSGQGISQDDDREVTSRSIPEVPHHDRKYSFKVCGGKFVHQRNLDRHESIHLWEKPFSCSFCDKKFYRKDLLKSHERCHKGKLPQCNLCRGRFVKLKEHIANIHSTSNREHFCSVCKKGFRMITLVRRHMLTHTDERNYSCQDCGARFPTKNQVKKHMVSHTKETNYICNVCGMKFSRASGLHGHMCVHSGLKPYSCETCGRAFKRSGGLRKHWLIHTSEKPFSCSTCGKAFHQSDRLTKHALIHSGEQPYECSECGMRFSQSGSLQRHKLTHTGEKPYSCSDCGQRFTRSDGLCLHQRNHCSVGKTQT